MTPLLIAGLAVFVALRAGLFNIGVEGQLIVGALACAMTASRFPGVLGGFLGGLAGITSGALWALPAAWIRAFRNGHEVITTIMLNNIAALVTTALVAGPWKAAGQESASTAMIDASSRLPNVVQGSIGVSWGLIVGLVAVGGNAIWRKRTVSGFEVEAVGASPTVAAASGVDVRSVLVRAMVTSGAIAGFGGAVMVLAFEGRFYQGLSSGYGFDALGVALLAGASSWALVPAALFFGILNKGGTAIQLMGVSKGITGVVLGFLIVISAALRYREVRRDA
jgi:simple sugar transport system permease protein